MIIRKQGWIHTLLRALAHRAEAAEKAQIMLEEALGHAYEGLLITDAEGCILKVNEAYARFLQTTTDKLVGRHVTEVIENTRMHLVAKSGVAEIAQLQKIRGHEMICSRIPIFENGNVVAVVGKVMFQNIEDLFSFTENFKKLKTELEFYKRELSKHLSAKYSFGHIVGSSKELEWVKELGRKVAASNTTVLLKGESGTGKELFAHAIHNESHRKLGPFIKVNCAAIPDTLFESELFGYREGAFTGAQKKGKKGKFALADKGTIFLDEISELPLTMQVKLLRVLQEKEIEPVGAEGAEAVDVRIIAASNRDLETLVKSGMFRHDLYYRLNVVMLEIPPLRSRREDIPLLIHFHLRQLERETGIPVEGVEPDVAEVLKRYDWPGNVRELRNILEQALYVKLGTTITRNDLPAALSKGATLSTPEAGRSLKAAVRQAEEEAIRAAIREEKGDKQAAALRLGISKSSLYAKVDQYDIRL
ncbi:sigma-54-dependent Fis family transcriptional regulator [Geobacter sp. SVR]|uniref:sigma-54 interaction domain-containing protein n=1 Tax=Geobacter sp. SVR TaxID=2495594 RepID=UPI00143EF9F4|nr:sigma 54-interacting transcriptional regulator [Geobacter sp. SVR]BCS55792.1 sigma-54-dependent Fis family transcriptional regulator [Geobacter sp. SVR]GCF83796.1 sigma-54-dependent Fis family transcriptional regulator [Geobacter sp. SVR]